MAYQAYTVMRPCQRGLAVCSEHYFLLRSMTVPSLYEASAVIMWSGAEGFTSVSNITRKGKYFAQGMLLPKLDCCVLTC